MKQIIKENGQIFEVCTNKNEFFDSIGFNCLFDNKIWHDEESSLTLWYKDGTQVNYMVGDKKQPLNQNNIIKGCYSGDTNLIYNCTIDYNEHYNDWQIQELQ
jgi:hypothetical protein